MTDDRRRRPNHTRSSRECSPYCCCISSSCAADLGPGYRLGPGHALVIADKQVKFLKYAARVILFCPIGADAELELLPDDLRLFSG